jgi:hypothetical protein
LVVGDGRHTACNRLDCDSIEVTGTATARPPVGQAAAAAITATATATAVRRITVTISAATYAEGRVTLPWLSRRRATGTTSIAVPTRRTAISARRCTYISTSPRRGWVCATAPLCALTSGIKTRQPQATTAAGTIEELGGTAATTNNSHRCPDCSVLGKNNRCGATPLATMRIRASCAATIDIGERRLRTSITGPAAANSRTHEKVFRGGEFECA